MQSEPRNKARCCAQVTLTSALPECRPATATTADRARGITCLPGSVTLKPQLVRLCRLSGAACALCCVQQSPKSAQGALWLQAIVWQERPHTYAASWNVSVQSLSGTAPPDTLQRTCSVRVGQAQAPPVRSAGI